MKRKIYDRLLEWKRRDAPRYALMMTVNLCYNSTEPNVGLKLNLDRSYLK